MTHPNPPADKHPYVDCQKMGEVMALCRTCHTNDIRPTKAECWTCYDHRRRTGRVRSEELVIKNNQRNLEREMLRKRQLS